ncbi:MAG TPA: hypothetical protein PLL32_04965 [Anaeromyxobacteraceae bacterium]|nr:hypothetical protein [Anaeromyxobacteraceae bacterium]
MEPFVVDQATVPLTGVVVPSVIVKDDARKVRVSPLGTVADAGSTFTLTGIAGPTSRTTVPVTPESCADIVVEPTPVPSALPAEVIVAMAGSDDVHVAWDVTSPDVPSEYVPLADRMAVVPLGAGAPIWWTAMVDNVGGGEPLLPPQAAIPAARARNGR